jgi:hypothetical protein
MPLLRGGRPLKRWCYAGIYDEALTLCAASIRVGPLSQAWWALWDPRAGNLRERTLFLRPGRVEAERQRLRIRDGDFAADVVFDEGPPVEVVSHHGDEYIWTRKEGGVRARGVVRVGGEERRIDARAIVDESAGYHARVTKWAWSAGVGTAADGRPVAWNLVEGVHDDPAASENTVWSDGAAREVGVVRFADDLLVLTGDDGSVLRFELQAERAHDDHLLLLSSTYRQPFGRFSGTLPGGIELADGHGVMERHEAHW